MCRLFHLPKEKTKSWTYIYLFYSLNMIQNTCFYQHKQEECAFNSLIPPSIFSSLLISMTTNFSHTANVGRVEEMNWPNLWGEKQNRNLSFCFCFCFLYSTRILPLVGRYVHVYENVFTAADRMGWGSPAAADWARCWWQLQSAGTVRCLSGSAAVWGSAEIPSVVWHF